eukprot:9014_1
MPRKVRKKLTYRTKRCTPKQKKERNAYNKVYKLQNGNKRLRQNAKNPSSPDPPLHLASPSPDTSPSTNNKQRILFDSLMPSLFEIMSWANFIFMFTTFFLVTVSSVPIKKLEITMQGLVQKFMGSWFAGIICVCIYCYLLWLKNQNKSGEINHYHQHLHETLPQKNDMLRMIYG